MIIKDLINRLMKFPSTANVPTTHSEDICISYIDDDPVKQVFIEEADECPSCFFYNDGYCCEYEKECTDVDECYQFIGDDDE